MFLVGISFLIMNPESDLKFSHFNPGCDVTLFASAEMIDKLTLTFNRTRQAVITKELIEIISGAAAL
ncbi:hypothetical protein GOODEAATRI_030668, partial [Goodea atripinnis]